MQKSKPNNYKDRSSLTGESKISTEQLSSQIDYSEIPEWTEEDFAKSKRGLFYRPDSLLVRSAD